MGLVASFLVLDHLEWWTTLPHWTLGATISFCGATWVSRLIIPLGIWFQKVPACNVTTLEMDMLFWYLMHLGISGLLVWTQGPETFFDYSTASCRPTPCGSQTWLPQWWTSFFLWIRWPSLGWRGSVLAQSPYRRFVPCSVGTEVIALWSEHGCCAGTLRWVGGHTSCSVIHWWIGRGTGRHVL